MRNKKAQAARIAASSRVLPDTPYNLGKLDFDDLAGFVGAPPRPAAAKPRMRNKKAQAARIAASSRVLPDTPYNLGKL
ncbi:hypothetical protein C7E17_25665, partial [Stenotrophomonas maltophilia]